MNSKDRKDIVKQAQDRGYGWNSDSSKLINGSGGTVKISESGGSVSINGSKYNTPAGARKSTKW